PQGRFTQVDPIGMRSVDLSSPQTLNLYAYCTNDPVNHTDPSGQGFFGSIGKILKVVSKVLKIIAIVLAVVIVTALVIAWAAPAGSAWIALAKFMLFKLAPVLANILAAATGVTLGGYTIGTPPWNPNGRVGFRLQG